MSEPTLTTPSDEGASGESRPSLAPGTVVGGRYRVVRPLGAGGMGAVYEATHTSLGRSVALKVLHPRFALDAQVAARFLQEARLASEVRHRNVVDVSDFGHDPEAGQLFLVMELLDGESLADWIEREAPVAPAALLPLLEPVARVLAVLHARGVVHRDIKPENVFLAREKDGAGVEPKLLDFGIAKVSAGADVKLTATGATLGTPLYMAPEQAMGAREAGPAADQYALATIAYEALARQLPHEGENYNALIVAKVTEAPRPLEKLRPDLPTGLTEAIMRALSPKPADRYESVDAFRRALEPFTECRLRPAYGDRPREGTHSPQATSRDGTDLAVLPRGVTPAPSPLDHTIAAPAGAGLASVRAPAPAAGSTTAPQSISAAGAAPQGETRSPLAWLFVALCVPLLAFAAHTLRATLAPPPATPSTAPSATSERPSAATAVRDEVTFTLSFQPPSTRLELDGAPLEGPRAVLRRPRDGRAYRLRATAPGHEPYADVLLANESLALTHQLAPLAPTAPPVPGTASAAASPRATARPARDGAASPSSRPSASGNGPGRIGVPLVTDIP